ncbi:hypothetical protein [Saliphagus infecundisoli]|uniref:Uncharacterized protein n=1 Tax=Saliphagus infecundisoli TaxID=1849069 RepID=A0ABD5QM36_9EURY|nr:hypothetical protein [Saliphagus infecundisoli]
MADRKDEDEREWPEPGRGSASSDADWNRYGLGLRLACSVAALLVLVWLTRGFLVEVVPRLWPPTDPTSQWATLVTLHAFGYLVVPLMVGSLLADLVLERFLENQTE